jgi:hypothetical protein
MLLGICDADLNSNANEADDENGHYDANDGSV